MGRELLGGSDSSSGFGSSTKLVKRNLAGLQQPGAARDQAIGAFTLDPARYASVGQGYADTAGGKYLDVSSNPALAKYLETLNTQSNQGLQEAMAQLRSRFALGGQTSTAGSSPLLQAQGDAAVRSGQARDAIAAQALFGTYGQERQNQLAALGQLKSFELTPVQIMQALMPFLQKSRGTNSPGWLNAASSAIGTAVGAAAGAMCWVAREVYGEDNPKWQTFREWLMQDAPWLLRWAYLRYGERFAKFIHNKPRLKAAIKALMDLAIKEDSSWVQAQAVE